MSLGISKPSISIETVKKYVPHAQKLVNESEVRISTETGYTRSHLTTGRKESHAEMLAALFAHLRIRPHEDPIADIKSEFKEALSARKIGSILEIGKGKFPFASHFAAFMPSETRIFSFGFEESEKVDADGVHVSGKGDINTEAFVKWNKEVDFDLILSVGVQSFGEGFNNDIGVSGPRSSHTAGTLVSRLSDNPFAAYFASSWDIDILTLVQNHFSREVCPLLWTSFPSRYPGRENARIQMKDYFKEEPASLAVLAKR